MLRICVGNYPHTRPLKDGTVTSSRLALEFVETNPMVLAYRRMTRELAYDVCEMALTTYLVAKSFDKGFTALPLPLDHRLHHGDVQCRIDSGIAGPGDLAGKRVGVRAYTVTTGVWVRGLLQNEYGVDPFGIEWRTDDEEHVQEYRPPANVAPLPEGQSIVAAFESGAIDAAFGGNAGMGRTGAPRADWNEAGVAPAEPPPLAAPLFADAERLDREWYARTGIYPIHGCVVVRDEVLQRQPEVVDELIDLFGEAKQHFLDRLQSHGPQTAEEQRWARFAEMVGGDPIPFGLEKNRPTLEALLRFAHQQQLVPGHWQPEDVFA